MQAFYRLCNSLASYVRQHHSGGVAWNQNGIEVLEALRQLQSGQASTRTASTNDSNASPSNTVSPSGATSGAPPPPPPPPPPLPKFDTNQPLPPIPTAKNGVQRGSGDMGSVFDEINKGEGVTSGLRKVDKSQMTHKNPSLRTNSAVPARAGSNAPLAGRTSPVPRPKPESMRTKKPERMELDGNKWIVVGIFSRGALAASAPPTPEKEIREHLHPYLHPYLYLYPYLYLAAWAH